jgi:(p)ppGpp synthase/HD superfamily hydrolase
MNFLKISRAQAFAHEAHDSIKQIRKYSKEPYWVHTDAVAKLVELHGGDDDMICAAHLHDYREDVVTELKIQKRLEELDAFEAYYYENFGGQIDHYVVELTDVYISAAYPTLSRRIRKELERERIAKDSPKSKTIKLADLIHNTSSIVDNDPQFSRTYLSEKWALLPYLKEGNPTLWQIAHDAALAGMMKIGIPRPLNPLP